MCLKIEKEDDNLFQKFQNQGPFSALKSPFNNYVYQPNLLTPNLKSSEFKNFGSKEKNDYNNNTDN